MKRTFIALEIGIQDQKGINTLLNEYKNQYPRGLTWTKPENMHLTLVFIGDTKESDIGAISAFLGEIVQNINIQNLNRGEIEWSPFKDPRTLWIRYDRPSNEIIDAVKALKSFLKNRGYETDQRNLLYHVTLGRIKNIPQEPRQNRFLDQIGKEIHCDAITLYQSTLTPRGPIYQALARYPLKGGPHAG